MNEIIEKLRKRQDLNFEQSKSAFENIMTGKAKEEEIHDFLIASSSKGETQRKLQEEFMFYVIKLPKLMSRMIRSILAELVVMEKIL